MMARPQSFLSEFAPRLRNNLNALLNPVLPPASSAQTRVTKRGTQVINYSEEFLNDDDFEDSDGPRKPTGLRSKRDAPQDQTRDALVERLSKELKAPVETQGIWRDWFAKPNFGKTDKQVYAQSLLPLTLIPVRIDLSINSFQPNRALPPPPSDGPQNVATLMPQFRPGDPTPPYKLKDFFLWNLHESLITPKQFATILVQELDLPYPQAMTYIEEITNQIRTQLEEYAGVALHPLFHMTNPTPQTDPPVKLRSPSLDTPQTPAAILHKPTETGTDELKPVNTRVEASREGNGVSATAAPILSGFTDAHNPDDTYRCLITLSINLLNKLYTDKFEWSLLHPPGTAEIFAKQTCTDLGLTGEWVPALAHAIYEAVLRLKKEACESGGLVGGNGYGGEIDNSAAHGWEAGCRYDPEHLADEWEPKLEILSKEDIEKREGDRERQIRRLRRETARFSSATSIAGMPPATGYFDLPDTAETPLGRGERSKRKKRFRSLSPLGRSGTPGATSDSARCGAEAGVLSDRDRASFRCSHCLLRGAAAWSVRDGPAGPNTLCQNCSLLLERDKRLPPWMKRLHDKD